MKNQFIYLSALLAAAPLMACTQQEAETCQIWQEFVTCQETGEESKLLDFSFAGYRHAEVGVPDVDHKVFNVCDFGAVANDNLSDRAAFEEAIAAAEANGSGIIYFPQGRYNLHEKGEPSKSIRIAGSNIVLKGDGEGKTEIFMAEPNEAADPKKMWSSPMLIQFSTSEPRKKLTEVTGNAARGTFSVEVASTEEMKKGDWVCLKLIDNTQALVEEELAPYGADKGWKIGTSGVTVNDYHQIVAINGNKVTFKEPIMRAVDAQYNWTIESFPHLEEVGVEDISFVGNWKEKFVHHKSWVHDGGWKFISLNKVVNSWVRRCDFADVSQAVGITGSANVSVFDCVITGNTGHHAINSLGSSRAFIGFIDDQPAQWHSTGVASTSMGAVLWRTRTNNNSCFESHASQPRATLLDACEGGFMRGRAGGAIGSNPNHLADLVLWNYLETDEGSKDFDFWAKDSKYFRFMPPIIVGFHGAGTTFYAPEVAYEESNGTPVQPESLFEAQLELRLGELPQWIVELKKEINY